MTPEIERLLGGYATNSLSKDERKLLYEAALEDQDLFNALEDEQALRDLLTDDETRREVVRALRPEPKKASRGWIWGLGLAAGVAAVVVLVVVAGNPRPADRRVIVANSLPPRPLPEMASPLPPPAAPVKQVPLRNKAKTEEKEKEKTVGVQVESAASVSLGTGNLPSSRAMVTSANRFAPTAGLVRQEAITPGPYFVLRSLPSGLNASDAIQAGNSIQVELRPGLSGHLTLAERASDGSSKDLPSDAPIVVDREKVIRVEWLNPPSMPTQTTLLTLAPGKPPVIQPQP